MLKAFIIIIKQVARPQTLSTLVPSLLLGLVDILFPFGITLAWVFLPHPGQRGLVVLELHIMLKAFITIMRQSNKRYQH